MIINGVYNMRIKVNEQLVQEMSTANLDDHFVDFNYPTYKVVVKGSPREHLINGSGHVHISNKQEGWEIRMSLDGHFLSAVNTGKRNEHDTFRDIEKVFRKWLVRKNVTFPEITNYVYVQREWNTNNPEEKVTVKAELA